MTPVEWAVLATGVAAIGWVNWYFFLAERGTVVAGVQTGDGDGDGVGSRAGAGAGGGGTSAAEVTIQVKGGYSPATIRARAGQPVRLVFDRQETSGCSEEIVFPDFGIRKFLPAFQKTSVEVTPPRAGRYEFTCGMSMLRGTLVAEEQ
ncbi:MAG: cupredoxin domain-containing protein [Gemmatimonadaceae bacterium]